VTPLFCWRDFFVSGEGVWEEILGFIEDVSSVP